MTRRTYTGRFRGPSSLIDRQRTANALAAATYDWAAQVLRRRKETKENQK